MKRVFIYGGCTSRDAVEHYPEHGLEMLHYAARQSLISAFRPADPKEFFIPAEVRPFQRRMLEGDIQGNLPRAIQEHAQSIDLLVWDLMIERVGVAKVRSGGMVTRNTVEKAPGTAPIGGAYIFGEPGHMKHWSWALDKFIALLERLNLKEKVVINATPWAILDTDGNPAKSESTSTPEWFNEQVESYWALAESRGIRVARVPQEKAIADPNHKWGPAYFHYAPETYRAQLDAITAVL